jgi:hypothetical protein
MQLAVAILSSHAYGAPYTYSAAATSSDFFNTFDAFIEQSRERSRVRRGGFCTGAVRATLRPER